VKHFMMLPIKTIMQGFIVVVIILLLDLQLHVPVNQCLLPLKLWVRIPLMARYTRYNIIWLSFSVTCCWSVVFSR